MAAALLEGGTSPLPLPPPLSSPAGGLPVPPLPPPTSKLRRCCPSMLTALPRRPFTESCEYCRAARERERERAGGRAQHCCQLKRQGGGSGQRRRALGDAGVASGLLTRVASTTTAIRAQARGCLCHQRQALAGDARGFWPAAVIQMGVRQATVPPKP